LSERRGRRGYPTTRPEKKIFSQESGDGQRGTYDEEKGTFINDNRKERRVAWRGGKGEVHSGKILLRSKNLVLRER